MQDLEARVQRSNVIDGRGIVGIRLEEAAVEVALRGRKTRREGRRGVRMWAAAAGTNRRGARWREERVWSVASPSFSPWCALRGGEQCGTRARWGRRAETGPSWSTRALAGQSATHQLLIGCSSTTARLLPDQQAVRRRVSRQLRQLRSGLIIDQ